VVHANVAMKYILLLNSLAPTITFSSSKFMETIGLLSSMGANLMDLKLNTQRTCKPAFGEKLQGSGVNNWNTYKRCLE